MLEEFDLDVRRSALTKSYEKLQEKFKALRKQTFIALMWHSMQFPNPKITHEYNLNRDELDNYMRKLSAELEHAGKNNFYYWDTGINELFDKFHGAICKCYEHLSLDKEKLVEPFKELEDYYARTLTLLSDRNQTLCDEFEQKLIRFRADMLRLQTDIAFILRRNMIDEVEQQGKITLDNITSGQNLLQEADDSEPEEMVFESVASEEETNQEPGEL